MGAHQPRLVEVKTFAAVLGSILVVGALGSSVLFQAVEDRFLELQISANRRHARYLAEVVALRLENGVSRAEVLADLQNSRTASETGFVCVLDPGGTVLTHPDPAIADEPLPRQIRLSLAEIGDDVQLDVSDSGPGVPEDRRDRIFDAFLTTKGEGTGLGLSLCRRFVEAHDGTIELLVSPRGAHFRACLPTKGRL